MSKLKLAPLPDDKPVKVTVTLSAEQVALLAAYGTAVGSADGKPPSVERLIPPIIERFIRSDREFTRQSRPSTARRAGAPASPDHGGSAR